MRNGVTRCGNSNEWISAAVHGSIVLSYGCMILFHGTFAAKWARHYLRWAAYPIAVVYHAHSTIEHVQRATRE